MRAVDIIVKKRDKQELSREEIDFLISEFTADRIPDYQMSAWAMAVLLNGMTDRETTDLTMAMADSGDRLDLTRIVPGSVDKHSSGGVGDKTTLVVEPIVSAAGLPVAKMSGRGLGHSGGTLDKLESIPGIRTNLSEDEFIAQLREHGIALIGQTADMAPADGKLYALRDVTGTVPAIPLIASSIMSKKIASGASAVVLDVKVGVGSFTQDLESGRHLARLMVAIAKLSGRKATALLSDMNQPLGEAVGNAIEVKEAISTLQGEGPTDFRDHCLTVAAHMLMLGSAVPTFNDGLALAARSLDDGSAWQRFRVLVAAQGGHLATVDDPSLLPSAPHIETVHAPRSGYLSQIHARRIGEAVVRLGGGREVKGQQIDHSVGVEILRLVGDQVTENDPLFVIHAATRGELERAKTDVLGAHHWSDEPVEPLPLFYDTIYTE
ncbi:MAG: thymidine phosphorylase [Acidimicrobiia bacterium]|nr:thymidine phosphorylase [Acidimicrobiia bacterium]NNL26874.1 thymidine phosphorylase [Acidimicrobiia bacterium]